MALPAWLASMTQVPAAVKVTTPPGWCSRCSMRVER